MTGAVSAEDQKPDAFGKSTRNGIITVMMVQWLALLVDIHADNFGWSQFADVWWQTIFLSVVVIVPSSVVLCLLDRRDRRLWVWATVLAATMAVTGTATGYRLSGSSGLASFDSLFPYVVSIVILAFVITPFAQCRLLPSQSAGGNAFPYPDLFRHAWNNALTLTVAGIFTGLLWLLVALACGLFAVIGIKALSEIVITTVFIMPVTGLALGFGVAAGRTQHRAVLNLRRIVLAILRGLLPIIAVIAIVFIATLPLTGLAPLWQTGKAGLLLMALMLALIVFVNGVFQDGTGDCPYGWLTRRLVELALLTLPVYGALAAYGLYLRVAQYGWSVERVWAVVICLILSLYAVGYALAAGREWVRWGQGTEAVRPVWLASMGPLNVSVAGVLLVVLFALQLPWINPDAITVRSQLRRLTAAGVALSRDDINFLRFKAGRDGMDALRTLRAHPKYADNATIVADIDKALAGETLTRLDDRFSLRFPAVAPVTTTQQVADTLVVVPIGHVPPPDFLAQFLPDSKQNKYLHYCIERMNRCAVVASDLDRDGQTDYTVIDLSSASSFILFVKGDNGWQYASQGHIYERSGENEAFAETLLQDLRNGNFAPRPPRWDMLNIGGKNIIFRP